MSKKQTPEKFWARVKQGPSCWEWQGACNSSGYGTVAWHGTVFTAHRVAAWLSGMVSSPAAPASSREPTHILHKCDNRKCCNPEHMVLGSYGDNQRDAYQKARRAQPQGADHVNAKLTAEQVQEIRRRYAAGEMQVPLAKEFGVAQRTISLIVRKETYR